MVQNKAQVFKMIQENNLEIKQFGAKKLGLFGSFVRNQQKDGSDIDIVVEFQEGKKKYKNFINLAYFLQDKMNRKVELVTLESLASFVKKEVEKEIEYVAIVD